MSWGAPIFLFWFIQAVRFFLGSYCCPEVSCCSSYDVCVNIWDVAEESSNFFVFYVLFPDLVPFDAENSTDVLRCSDGHLPLMTCFHYRIQNWSCDVVVEAPGYKRIDREHIYSNGIIRTTNSFGIIIL